MRTVNSFVEILRSRAAHEPDAVAFTFARDLGEPEDVLTYAALDRGARAIAARLQERGMTGQRAVLLYPPGVDYVVAFFACLYAGTVAVPAYPPRDNASLDRVIKVVERAGAAVMLTTSRVQLSIAKIAPDLSHLEVQWLTTEVRDDQYAEFWVQHEPARHATAIIQFTSGSTGNPKGVVISHGNLLTNSGLICDAMELGPASRGVIWLPPYHDMGLIGGVLQPIYAGFPVHLMSPALFIQRPLRWLQAISEKRATISGAPNFAYDLCVDRVSADKLEGLDLSHWQLAFNGAEPLRASTMRAFAEFFGPCGFRQSSFFPCYGLAEATLLVSGSRLVSEPKTLDVSVQALENNLKAAAQGEADRKILVGSGRPVKALKLRIVDVESRLPCADGRIGEIWVQGDTVASGYWQNPDMTANTFNASVALEAGVGSYLRTGDLGFLEQGELYVTGRLKDLIIVRGKNHYPQDIEDTVTGSHDGLQKGSAAAFLLDDDAALGVAVEVRRGFSGDPAQAETAIIHAVSKLHGLAVKQVALLRPGSIAKTSSGKVRRFLCRRQMGDGTLAIFVDKSAEIGKTL